MPTEHRDYGVKALLSALDYLDKNVVDVGIFDREHANILVVNEFGSEPDSSGDRHIPERHAFRTALRHHRSTMKAMIARGAVSLQRGRITYFHFVTAIGSTCENHVKVSIRDWSDPRNADYTIRRKGFNDPLVHTGMTLAAVHHQIRRKGTPSR